MYVLARGRPVLSTYPQAPEAPGFKHPVGRAEPRYLPTHENLEMSMTRLRATGRSDGP